MKKTILTILIILALSYTAYAYVADYLEAKIKDPVDGQIVRWVAANKQWENVNDSITVKVDSLVADSLYLTFTDSTRLLRVVAGKVASKVDTVSLSEFVAGTANEITVTDQDGAITLSLVLNKDIVAGTALSGGADNVLPGADSDVTISVTADAIGDTQLEYNTGQHLTTSSSPSFTKVTTTEVDFAGNITLCLLYTSPSPRDGLLSRMPSSA